MTPNNLYQQKLEAGQVKPDKQQAAVIEKLTQIHSAASKPRKKLFTLRRKKTKGLYIWGTVGIGKTFMMDLFCQSANFPVLRQHFFDFMQYIHRQLNEFQGQTNPLEHIATQLANKIHVICFDEFFVSDITDAMLLGTLFQKLFERGTILIATSNVPPNDLYKNGLQRERFLPAIAAIQANTQVMHLENTYDYRYRNEILNNLFINPLNKISDQHMLQLFRHYGHNTEAKASTIVINDHPLQIKAKSQGVIWCDFESLCKQDRSQQDYLNIAQHFHTLLLDKVTPIPANDRKTILRFIHLIDILYDNGIRLAMAAACSIKQIYPKGPYSFEYRRTLSRLNEMQTPDYLANNKHP